MLNVTYHAGRTVIVTTGQRAQVSLSIIAGQPRRMSVVEVVKIDGDRLTYKIDEFWTSSATRTRYVDWEIIDDTPPSDANVIRVPREQAELTAHAKSLQVVLDAVEVVDSYCVDYLDARTMKVDRDMLRLESLANLDRTLGELDEIVSALPDVPASSNGGLATYTIERARSLAAAIRQAADQIVAAAARANREAAGL